MKKIIALLCILIAAPTAMAVIYSEDIADPAFMQNKGYSQTLIRAVDAKKSHMTGSENTYTRYYQPKTAKKPTTPLEYVTNWYEKAKIYLDPIQDDGHFTERENEFTNDWFPELPEEKYIENL